MNKLAYMTGYLEKEAGSEAADLIRRFVKYPALVGAPIGAGYLGGRAMADIQEPTKEEVALIQAKYVRDKFQQAIEDLDKRKNIEVLKEKQGGTGGTLRI